jgi:hypothetical protein
LTVNLSEETLQNATDSGVVFDLGAKREQQASRLESIGPHKNAIVPDWKVKTDGMITREQRDTMEAFIIECVEDFRANRIPISPDKIKVKIVVAPNQSTGRGIGSRDREYTVYERLCLLDAIRAGG